MPKTIAIIAAVLAVLSALGGCARGPVPMRDVLPGQVFAVPAEALDAAQVAEAARGADYVLLGEGHSVACDHRVQADVLAALAEGGAAPVLGLEMVPVDLQPVLDRFNAGELGVDDLEEALDWKHTWGHAFSGYASVLRAARRLGVPVAALNVPRRVVDAVSEGGLDAVAEADRAWLPGRVLPPARAQREALDEEFSRHRDMLKERGLDDALERFVLVQSLWDTAMAGNAAAARACLGGPVVVLAGSGHVEYGWGIAHRLRELDPGARTLLVMPWRGLDAPDADAADLFFYCPMTSSSRLGFTLKLLPGGVEVEAVAPGARAETAGFRPGDRIVAVQGLPVEDLWVLHKAAVAARRDGEALRFDVLRGEDRLALEIPLSAAHGAGPDSETDSAPGAASE